MRCLLWNLGRVSTRRTDLFSTPGIPCKKNARRREETRKRQCANEPRRHAEGNRYAIFCTTKHTDVGRSFRSSPADTAPRLTGEVRGPASVETEACVGWFAITPHKELLCAAALAYGFWSEACPHRERTRRARSSPPRRSSERRTPGSQRRLTPCPIQTRCGDALSSRMGWGSQRSILHDRARGSFVHGAHRQRAARAGECHAPSPPNGGHMCFCRPCESGPAPVRPHCDAAGRHMEGLLPAQGAAGPPGEAACANDGGGLL